MALTSWDRRPKSSPFNAQGACPYCEGTGTVRTVNIASLVPDENLTIDQGAVAPWQSLMWSLMTDVCRAMGVRTDVPFKNLTDEEKDIVYHGPAIKQHILYRPKNPKKSAESTELDFTYYNAIYTVENALAKVKDESGMKRIAKFLTTSACPHCQGTRLSEAARAHLIDQAQCKSAEKFFKFVWIAQHQNPAHGVVRDVFVWELLEKLRQIITMSLPVVCNLHAVGSAAQTR